MSKNEKTKELNDEDLKETSGGISIRNGKFLIGDPPDAPYMKRWGKIFGKNNLKGGK